MKREGFIPKPTPEEERAQEKAAQLAIASQLNRMAEQSRKERA